MEYDGDNLTKSTRFVYMGYLMVASMDSTQNISNLPLLGTLFWDPSEPAATRVLGMCTHNADRSVASTRYAAHDLLKNVSALFDSSGTPQAKFEYTPYGEMLTIEGAWASAMPFCYSSEYRDEDLGLVYYNYRHYNPRDGRWISRDPIKENGGWNIYCFVKNNPVLIYEYLGISFKSKEERYGEYCILSQDPSDIEETVEFYGTKKPERRVHKISEAVIDEYTKYPKVAKTAVTGLAASGLAFNTAGGILTSMQVHVTVEFTCKCVCKCKMMSVLSGEATSAITGEFTITSRSFGQRSTLTDGFGIANKVPQGWKLEEKKQDELNRIYAEKLKEYDDKCKKIKS